MPIDAIYSSSSENGKTNFLVIAGMLLVLVGIPLFIIGVRVFPPVTEEEFSGIIGEVRVVREETSGSSSGNVIGGAVVGGMVAGATGATIGALASAVGSTTSSIASCQFKVLVDDKTLYYSVVNQLGKTAECALLQKGDTVRITFRGRYYFWNGNRLSDSL